MPAIEKRKAKRLAALAQAASSVPISFAIVGVQKAATTSLYQMLALHPRVVDGPQKEMRFFLEARDWSDPDYSTYRRPVLSGDGDIAGDATPAYLFWPGALERMRAYDPGLRLMAAFRDPIERAFSHWSMERMRHSWYPDLPQAIESYGHDPLPTEISADRPGAALQRSPFSRGLYGAQLERGLAHFPAERWLLFEFREITGDHRRSLDRATDHLGIERFETYPELDHRMATPTTNDGTAPSVAAIEGLVRHYADDLALFERLSGIDTSRWSTRRVIDGTLEVEEFHATLCAKLGLAT